MRNPSTRTNAPALRDSALDHLRPEGCDEQGLSTLVAGALGDALTGKIIVFKPNSWAA
jgi:hypothetical protein